MKIFQKITVLAVACLVLVVSSAVAYATAEETKIGYWADFWIPGYVITMAADRQFFGPGVKIIGLPKEVAHTIALRTNRIDVSTSVGQSSLCTDLTEAEQVNKPECKPIYAGFPSRGHNYVLIGEKDATLVTIGSVSDVLTGPVAVSRCEIGTYIEHRKDAITNKPTVRNTATGIIIAYVLDKNVELEAAGLPTVGFFCGSKEDYEEAVAQKRVTSKKVSSMVFGLPRGGSKDRYASLNLGEVDMAIAFAPFHLLAQRDGFKVVLDSTKFRPFPDIIFVMTEERYKQGGEKVIAKLCTGVNRAVQFLKDNRGNKEIREDFAKSLYISKKRYGDIREQAINEMLDRTIRTMGGDCRASRRLMEMYAALVVSSDKLEFAPSALSE